VSTTDQGTTVGTTQLKAKEMITTMTTQGQKFVKLLKLKTKWQSSK